MESSWTDGTNLFPQYYRVYSIFDELLIDVIKARIQSYSSLAETEVLGKLNLCNNVVRLNGSNGTSSDRVYMQWHY